MPFLNIIGGKKAVVDIGDKPGVKLVLVFAYMRGGSTFLGRDIIGRMTGSYHFYEPLWKLTKYGYYTNNSFCELKGKCR